MKNYLLLLAFISVFSLGSKAQTYSSWGIATANGTAYDTIAQYNDTLNYVFTGMPLGAFGNARLVIYFEGDFGDNSEYLDAYNTSTSTLIGSSINTMNGDCSPEDSTIALFSGANLDIWQSAGVWSIYLLPTNNVDLFCATQRVRVRLEYDYCAAGTPAQFASIVPDTNFVCSHNTTGFTLSPSGGTFSGPSLTGNIFNPAGLSSGEYTFNYTATDSIGCTTSTSAVVTIGNFPVPQSYLVCEGGNSPVLNGSVIEYTYGSDIEFVLPIDTATAFVYGPITLSPDTIYYSAFSRNDSFILDTVTNDTVVYIDHNSITGDDRGGIAITDSSVYIVGDNFTGLYDLDLTSLGVSLPIMDGLFSDLKARKLWTLYNSVSSTYPNNSGTFTVDAIAELDANLAVTGTIIPLSQNIPMGSNMQQGIILAGYGKLGLYNGTDIFIVDVQSGQVDLLGQFNLNVYGSENWVSWGNLGYNGSDWFAYYRDGNNDQIVSHNLSNNVITQISQLPGSSDMSSITYHPTNNRLYFHYEGSGNYGGSSETLGFVDASATIIINPTGERVGCPSPIEFTFNKLDLGSDTTICQSNAPYILQAGFGYSSYSWNGVNNNWNVYPVSSTQTVIGEVVDASSCILRDTVVVTVDGCLGLDEKSSALYSIYPNPNNGSFNILLENSVDNLTVEVMDTKGRKCHSQTFNGNVQNAKVETSNLEKGIYFVSIRVNDKLTQATITVQ
jgi:hypothetical protein